MTLQISGEAGAQNGNAPLGIVLKELRESAVWIRLIVKSELMPGQRLELLQDECDQLCKIIAKSLVTAKSNQSRPDKVGL